MVRKSMLWVVMLLVMALVPIQSEAVNLEVGLGVWYEMPGINSLVFIDRIKFEHPITALPDIALNYAPILGVFSQFDLTLYYGITGVKTATAGMFDVHVGLNGKLLIVPSVLANLIGTPILPVPMLYGDIIVSPPSMPLSAALEVRLIPAIILNTSVYDFLLRLKYNVLSFAFIDAGYRLELFSTSISGFSMNLPVHGPFVEVGVNY